MFVVYCASNIDLSDSLLDHCWGGALQWPGQGDVIARGGGEAGN